MSPILISKVPGCRPCPDWQIKTLGCGSRIHCAMYCTADRGEMAGTSLSISNNDRDPTPTVKARDDHRGKVEREAKSKRERRKGAARGVRSVARQRCRNTLAVLSDSVIHCHLCTLHSVIQCGMIPNTVIAGEVDAAPVAPSVSLLSLTELWPAPSSY